ncbi:MAG: cytochrome c peroxidase, partial [Campylobacterales bacterium]
MHTKGLVTCMTVLGLSAAAVMADPLTPMEELGKSIFFDQNLSKNSNQACAACHSPETGFTGPIS